MYPVDEERWDIEVMGFLDHLVMVDGIEGRAEIDEEEPGKGGHYSASCEHEFGCTLLDDPRLWSLPWCAPDHLPAHVFHREGGWVFWIREGIWSPSMLYSPRCKSECKRCSGFQ